MKKFKIYLITSILIVTTVLPLTSCSNKNNVDDTKNETTLSSTETENKDAEESKEDVQSSNETSNSSSSTSSNNASSASNSELNESKSTLNNQISYPVFSGIKNSEKVNKLVLDYAKKLNDLYSPEDGEILEVNYKTTFKSEKYISIYFYGDKKNTSTPYPVTIKATVNINIEKANIMHLEDIVNINDKFINAFSKGIETEFKSLGTDVLDTYKRENLKSLLQKADRNETNFSDVQSYFTDDEIVIKLSVIHALGDYMEIHIPNSSIDKII